MTDSPPVPEPDISGLSFEQALAQLEEIVAKLESGQTELERSIALYERGARLKAHCEARLRAAQLRVDKIVVGRRRRGHRNPARRLRRLNGQAVAWAPRRVSPRSRRVDKGDDGAEIPRGDDAKVLDAAACNDARRLTGPEVVCPPTPRSSTRSTSRRTSATSPFPSCASSPTRPAPR